MSSVISRVEWEGLDAKVMVVDRDNRAQRGITRRLTNRVR